MKNNRGFTLIELLFYISLSIVILFGTVDFILNINTLRQRGFMISEVENQGLRIVDMMTKQIRNSRGVNEPPGTGDVLSLVSNNIDKNPIIFRLNNGSLEYSEGGSIFNVINNNQVIVENLYFSGFFSSSTKGLVKIQFDLKFNSKSENPKLNYRQTFYGAASVR